MKIDRSNVFPGLLSNEITRGSIVPLSRPRQMLEIHPLNKIYRLDYPAFLTCAKAHASKRVCAIEPMWHEEICVILYYITVEEKSRKHMYT